MKKAAVAIALIALAQSAAYLVRSEPSTPDGIGSLIAAYKSVAPLLPVDGVVGFVDTSPNVDVNTVNYYVAQQALAPRVLSREIGAEAEFVITTTAAPQDVTTPPALDGFTLVGAGEGNVRVFRRRGP